MSDVSRSFRSGTGQFDSDGSFATAKLKTYPPRLNGCFVLALLRRFSSIVGVHPDEQQRVFLSARDTIVARCQDIDSLESSDFVEQDLTAVVPDTDPLRSFIDWPDRHAGRGKDFAF